LAIANQVGFDSRLLFAPAMRHWPLLVVYLVKPPDAAIRWTREIIAWSNKVFGVIRAFPKVSPRSGQWTTASALVAVSSMASGVA
jgi:hypothetical protein